MTRQPRAGRHRAGLVRRPHWRRHAVAAALLAVAAVLVAAYNPKSAPQVPELDAGQSGVSLQFAFSFPGDDDTPLERPVGVTVAGGRVFVADSTAGVVRVYDDRGVERGVVGEGALAVPVYVAADVERGVLYVSDRAKRTLFLFGLGDGALVGTLVPKAPEGSSIATAWAPLGIAVGDSGALYVTDVADRHRLLSLEPDGLIIREIGGAQAAAETTGVAVTLDYPNAVAVSGDEVWVADSNNKRALVFASDGAFLRVVPTGALVRGFDFLPPVIGAAETTTVVFVDTLGSGISLMDLSGASLGRFGGAGSSAGRLAFPNDISVDARLGRLYVADTGNRRVQAWDIGAAAAGERRSPPLAFGSDGGWRLAIAMVAGFAALVMTVIAVRAARPSRGMGDAWVASE